MFGYLVHSSRDFLRTTERLFWTTGALAAVLFPLSLYLTHLDIPQVRPAPMLHLLTVLVHALCTWSLIYFFIGGALRYFDRESAWTLYLSNSAYWVFLLHMPVVTFLAWALLPYDLPAVVKFTLLVVTTSAVCLLSYHYLVQRSWISVFLNGKRFDSDWPWRQDALRRDQHTLARGHEPLSK